jgi:hypothetical protein
MLDYYERHLLALAVEACVERTESFEFQSPHEDNPEWAMWLGAAAGFGSLADALTALLTDLGVTVPVRPSAEAVREATEGVGLDSAHVDCLRELVAHDPLLAAAVLEGGS